MAIRIMQKGDEVYVVSGVKSCIIPNELRRVGMNCGIRIEAL